MKIEIIPVVETKLTQVEEKVEVEIRQPAIVVPESTTTKDPAAQITFMEAEELKFLLDYIQSRLDETKTNKQKLVFIRDRVLVGIMSLEGCRTVETFAGATFKALIIPATSAARSCRVISVKQPVLECGLH